MIIDCEQWCDSVWAHYRAVKDDLIGGGSMQLNLDQFEAPPHKFFDILDQAATNIQ
jgi:hypothetical protein